MSQLDKRYLEKLEAQLDLMEQEDLELDKKPKIPPGWQVHSYTTWSEYLKAFSIFIYIAVGWLLLQGFLIVYNALT